MLHVHYCHSQIRNGNFTKIQYQLLLNRNKWGKCVRVCIVYNHKITQPNQIKSTDLEEDLTCSSSASSENQVSLWAHVKYEPKLNASLVSNCLVFIFFFIFNRITIKLLELSVKVATYLVTFWEKGTLIWSFQMYKFWLPWSSSDFRSSLSHHFHHSCSSPWIWLLL